jgi:3-methyladenine DNA glycosylase Mpg
VLSKNPVTNPSEWAPLSKDFFAQETPWVAKNLIGKVLILTQDLNNTSPLERPMALRIVETEAYTQDDPACHAYQKTTGRAATLYKAPGLSYVYLIYGMYYLPQCGDRTGRKRWCSAFPSARTHLYT